MHDSPRSVVGRLPESRSVRFHKFKFKILEQLLEIESQSLARRFSSRVNFAIIKEEED